MSRRPQVKRSMSPERWGEGARLLPEWGLGYLIGQLSLYKAQGRGTRQVNLMGVSRKGI